MPFTKPTQRTVTCQNYSLLKTKFHEGNKLAAKAPIYFLRPVVLIRTPFLIITCVLRLSFDSNSRMGEDLRLLLHPFCQFSSTLR